MIYVFYGNENSTIVKPLISDGRPRVDRFFGIVNMGCYEYLPQGAMYSVP